MPAPSDTSCRRWSVTAPFDSSRLVGAASLRRCIHHSPRRARRVPGAKGSCRNDQRARADAAGFGWMPGCTPDRSQHPPQISALNALPAVRSNRFPQPTPPATVYQSIGERPLWVAWRLGSGAHLRLPPPPSCPAVAARDLCCLGGCAVSCWFRLRWLVPGWRVSGWRGPGYVWPVPPAPWAPESAARRPASRPRSHPP